MQGLLPQKRFLLRVVGGLLFVLLPLLTAGISCAGEKSETPPPVHKGSHVLVSKDLVVEVMDPNDPERYNRGHRFSPVAAILRVDLGEDEYLYNPVEHDPLKNHAGLAPEFDIWNLPPGYEEAEVGGSFVKIGVGVLKKIVAKYRFSNPYPAVELAPTTVEWGKSTAKFKQSCPGVRGYAYDLEAEIVVRGKTVNVNWKLTNTGTRPLACEQYVHDWFAFNHQPVGPGYVVTFPYEITPRDMKPEQEYEGRNLKFVKEVPASVNIKVPYPADYTGRNDVSVRNEKTGQWILCKVSMPGAYTSVFATKNYICPEMFINLNLKPGESKSWTRTYIFGKAKPKPQPQAGK